MSCSFRAVAGIHQLSEK